MDSTPHLRLARQWLYVLVALLPSLAPAQPTDLQAYAELLENFILKNPAAAETDAPTLPESLAARLENPLNLNRAEREDLAALHLLSDLQIENLLAYRTFTGAFVDIHELQAIPGWDLEDVRRVRPLVCVGDTPGNQALGELLKMSFSGKNELLFRWAKATKLPDSERFEGTSDWLALRYRHNSPGDRLRFGFTTEKDPGEAAFRGSNPHGFDSFSGHFFLQNPGKTVRSLALGDFSARFGQGLLLQMSFAPGKTAETLNIARGGQRLKPFTAFGEIFYFRGAGATVALGKHWEATAFASNIRRDASLRPQLFDPEDEPLEREFSALQASGLHRTESEIENEKSVRERTAGFALIRTGKRGHVAANLLHFDFDKAIEPGRNAAQQFRFSGKKLTSGSLDFMFSHRNLVAFGETAMSQNGAAATLNGLLFAADRRVTLALLHRHFGRAYQSIYATPFAETDDAANEQGLYLGLEIRPARGWQLNGYADVWRHRWARFGANAPSAGHEFLGMARFAPTKTFALWLRFRSETKERNATADGHTFLETNRRQRVRFQAEYRLTPSVEMHSRAEWAFFQVENQAITQGFLMFQEASFRKPGSRLSATSRYVLFDSEDSDTRIYTFERDVFSALSVPSFGGRGSRFYLYLTWRAQKWLTLESRFGQTILQKSVSQTAQTGRRTEVKVQARVRW